MVLTRLPLTMTGNLWGAGCCACALCNRPQLQKVIAAAAPTPVFRKSRRVVMARASLAFVVKLRVGYAMGRQQGARAARTRKIRSHRLDAGLGDDVAPLRHF